MPMQASHRLGFGGAINQSIPTQVACLAGVRVLSVVAHHRHIIALSVNGRAFSWRVGCHGCHGQLGHGDEEDVAQMRSER